MHLGSIRPPESVKRLVVLMPANMEVLKAVPEFNIDETVCEKDCKISASTVDRLKTFRTP
jgi:hypothetical protein